MSTIKTWNELSQSCDFLNGRPIASFSVPELMSIEIKELREALKVAQTEVELHRRVVHRLQDERDALQAKLSAIEAQEPVAWMEWDLEIDEGDPDSITAGKEKPDLCADGWDWAALYLTAPVAPAIEAEIARNGNV